MNKLTLTKTEAGEVKHILQQWAAAVRAYNAGATHHNRIVFKVASDAVRGALVQAGGYYHGNFRVSFALGSALI